MKRLFKALLAPFAWNVMDVCGTNALFYNSVTDEKRIVHLGGGYTPIKSEWLD